MGLITLPGVFRPISDSQMLAERLAAASGPGLRVLDLCTGSGVIALAAAAQSAEVTAIDVSRRAVATVRVNGLIRRQPIRALRGRLFEPVAGERFDVIASNPPYVPSPAAELPVRGPSRAWVAGRDGRAVLDEICDQALGFLRPQGQLLLVHSSINGEQTTLDRLRRAGFVKPTVLDRHRGPLGPLMREQQAAGTVPVELEEEDVLVIGATAPTMRS